MRGSSPFFSNAIASMTREEGQKLTFSHALVCIGEGKNPDIIEAVVPRVRKVKLAVALHSAEYAVCLRPVSLTGMQRARIVAEACRNEGKLYGFDSFFGPKLFGAMLNSDTIEELLNTPRMVDCSELAGLCLVAANVPIGDEPAGLVPNELYEYALRHPKEWHIFSAV